MAKSVSGQPPDTPGEWFSCKFPNLERKYGPAVEEVWPDGTQKTLPYIKDLSEDFLAATLGEEGKPDAPTVFVAPEGRFYTYSPEAGIFVEAREAKLSTILSDLLLECARACSEKLDTSNLLFKSRDSASTRGVLARARGVLEVGPDFFQTGLMDYIPCLNGMLRLSDKVLLPFSASYRRRNKLGVAYQAGAKCPLLLETLLQPALAPEDIDLLQRWSGLALVGVNLAQRLMILTGTPGGGKGTFIRVLNGIVGPTNVGTLRPNLLCERFELGRLLGKSLLYGADVPDTFLNCKGASVIKALTGGDPVTLEFKGSNERPEIVCRFNIVVSCNSRLRVRLEGDLEAWRRRLASIEYRRSKPDDIITDLSERILGEEGSGALNWMIEGLDKIRADGWQLRLTTEQQLRVDDLLLESDGDVVFARECLVKDSANWLTGGDCYERYLAFCSERNWISLSKREFSSRIQDTISRMFGLTQRNDVPDCAGVQQRGWKGISCR